MNELTANGDLNAEILARLESNGGGSSVIVTRQTLRNALGRFLKGEIDQVVLVKWANTLEAYDQVRYAHPHEKLIADVVFSISSPEINGALSNSQCQALLQQLR